MKSKILIVDDNADLVDLIAPQIEAKGYNVASAGSGKEALDKLSKESPPDLILLDVQMPEMDGPQFLDQVEKTFPSLLQKVPVVFSSAGAPPADRRVSGFIDKMTDLSDYLSQVTHHLEFNVAASA